MGSHSASRKPAVSLRMGLTFTNRTGLPVELLGRVRSDRVMRKPVRVPWISPPQGGRPPKHGKEFRFAKPDTWGEPDAATVQVTDRYGTARAMAWDRIRPRLTTRSAWIDHTGELPLVEGTLIRLQVDRLPGGGDPLPVWLWSSATGLSGEDVDVRWQAFLRRFDLEHTFRVITDPRLGPAEAPHPRGRRPLDLADHRRPHPAEAPPPGRRRFAAPLGATGRAGPADPRACPPRVPEPPPAPRLPGPCTQTLTPRAGAATRLEEPAARHPL
jgi:hypothetical protein